MKKKRFSVDSNNKKATKKALDHFDQEDQKVNGDDIRGGNWTEYGGGPEKEEEPDTTKNRLS